jgi:uncharacterized protein YndB with AHSA1/START domain
MGGGSEDRGVGGGAAERWIRMTRRLDASTERVFRAWADPEELARWLPEQVEGGLAAGARTFLVWHDRRVAWDVQEVEPHRSFVFRRHPATTGRVATTVRITTTPVGYGSRLELEDGPYAVDQPESREAWAEAIERWSEALTMLRAYLDFSVDVRTRR